ncbi:MAG: triphosphoribosyl-dephospho-CoA synthase [Vicinamibacterales bacterium]
MPDPDLGTLAQLACLLEVSAPKPGNVSPGRPFRDVTHAHFLASALAVGEAFRDAGAQPVGVTIRRAIAATRRWCPCNTNLGIVLLLAPLARAVATAPSGGVAETAQPLEAWASHGAPWWARAVRRVLEATTVDDARETYAAIRLAAPGGLGRADQEDVADEPGRSLLEVMRLAADRDAVAREYATAYEVTRTRVVPALLAARAVSLTWDDAIVETSLELLAAAPDTHVARRAGQAEAETVRRDAQAVVAAGGVRTEAGRRHLAAFDASLRDPLNRRNPGATADLVTAGLFVVLAHGAWQETGYGSADASRGARP